MFKDLTLVTLDEWKFRNVILPIERDGFYFEIQIKRDRSSFAGVGLRVIKDAMNENKLIYSEKYRGEEFVLETKGKYEKIFLGMETDYLQSLKNEFSSQDKNYGLEVLFLVYSDVKSSPKIFEELMQNLDERITELHL